MADLVVECGFLRIVEKAHNRALGRALRKTNSRNIFLLIICFFQLTFRKETQNGN